MTRKLFTSPVIFDYEPGGTGTETGGGSGAGGDNPPECSWEDWQDMTEYWVEFGEGEEGYLAYCEKYGFDPYLDDGEWPPNP